MQRLVIFGVEYIYWWCWLWLSLAWIIIFGVDYDYFRCKLWLYLSLFLSMWYIFYLWIIQELIFQREKQQFKVDKNWRGLRCAWVDIFSLRKILVTRTYHVYKWRWEGRRGGSVSAMNREHLMKKRWGCCNLISMHIATRLIPELWWLNKVEPKWILLSEGTLTWSIPRCSLRSHYLVCIIIIGQILNKELDLYIYLIVREFLVRCQYYTKKITYKIVTQSVNPGIPITVKQPLNR